MTLILPTIPGITYPRDISFGQFDTNVQTSVSGKISTYPNKINPTRTYNVVISGLDSSGNNPGLVNNSFQTLQGFFNQCYGRLLPFQYTDSDDNAVVTQQFGTGDGATVAFQLLRSLGGFVEQVFAPTGTPNIYIGGVLKTSGVDYTISSTGVVTFTSAPSVAALTWTGSYNWWCHWDTDSLDLSQFMSGYYEAKKLSFTTRVF